MSKMIAGDEMRDARSRLEREGQLGRHIDLIGKHIQEIKAKRRKLGKAPDRATFDPNDPEYDRFPPTAPLDDAVVSEHTMPSDITSVMPSAIQDLVANRDRQAAARAHLAVQGQPLLGKAREEEEPPGRPTQEFLEKSGGEKNGFDISIAGKGERAPVRRYVLRSPAESFRKQMPADVENAFKRFCQDAEAAGIFRVTANYDGVGGGSRGPRTGGLGDVDQMQRAAYARHEDRLRLIGQLMDTPESRVKANTILAWAILRERLNDGRALTLEELGARLVPDLKSPDARRGAARQAIEMVGRLLVNVDHIIDGKRLRLNGGEGLMSRETLHKLARK